MKPTTHERLRRTAAEAVGSIPGIEAVVLYGSRARGTARAASDWDVAILSHASPDDERAARRFFDDLERVHPIVMRPESIEAHCNQGTRLESAIARQGRLLAGEWTPPPCRTENLDVTPEDLGENLETADTRPAQRVPRPVRRGGRRSSLRPQRSRGFTAGGGSAGQDRHRRVRALAGGGARSECTGDAARERLPGDAFANPKNGGASPRPSARSTGTRRPRTKPATAGGRSSRRRAPRSASRARSRFRRTGFAGTPSATRRCGARPRRSARPSPSRRFGSKR